MTDTALGTVMVISTTGMPPAQIASTARVASSTRGGADHGNDSDFFDSANYLFNGHMRLPFFLCTEDVLSSG